MRRRTCMGTIQNDASPQTLECVSWPTPNSLSKGGTHESKNVPPQTSFQGTPKCLLSLPRFLKPGRLTRFPATSIHRCLFISEIFSLILEFIQQSDELPKEGERDECMEERALSKRTLASVARTCRAFSAPALDLLWMRLDSLDPLIKVLPNRLWAMKHPRFVVRMLMGNKHWSTFYKYAVRVQYLRGPCRDISPLIQHNVVTTLARFSGGSLPLLPNLTELIWNRWNTSLIDPTMPLIKYFAGPRVVSLSILLVLGPVQVSARAVLPDLPNLCPNVTSFTAIPCSCYSDHSRDIGNIVGKWSNLRVLGACALPQTVMDELASKGILNTLSIVLNLNAILVPPLAEKLPTTVRTFSLDGDPVLCIRYLQTLQGNPTRLRLQLGLDITYPSDMVTLFQMLPTRFDTTQLRNLTILLGPPFPDLPALCPSFPLMESLLAPLYAFSSLVALDVDSFSVSHLDNAAYERMAGAWPELRSLKVGVADPSRARPVASVGAVIAMLRSCPCLETLHIVFDGSIPPPPPTMVLDADEDIQHGEEAGGDKAEEVGVDGAGEGKKKRVATSRTCSWGISNQYITRIHVGHSPIREDVDCLKNLASCLKSVMPRLGRIIRSRKEPPAMPDVGESEGWQTVQRLLVENDMDSTDLPLKV